MISATRPYAGNSEFALLLSSVPASTPAILLVALSQTSINLTSAGMPGCSLYMNPASPLFLALSAVTNAFGAVAIELPLPDYPVATGDVYFQYFYLNPGQNPANLGATHGLKAQVR